MSRPSVSSVMGRFPRGVLGAGHGEVLERVLGVDWFNAVDATYRSDFKDLFDTSFGRLEAILDSRLVQFEAKLDRRLVDIEAKWDKLFAGLKRGCSRRGLAPSSFPLQQYRVAQAAGGLDLLDEPRV